MKEEKLLKPRYEVLADFPGSEYTTGEVITEFHNAANTEVKIRSSQIGGGAVIRVASFPHLFRKMTWWEKRAPEDMPEYVRALETDAVMKVKEWIYGPTSGPHIKPGHPLYHCIAYAMGSYTAMELLPIPEAEYKAITNNEKLK